MMNILKGGGSSEGGGGSSGGFAPPPNFGKFLDSLEGLSQEKFKSMPAFLFTLGFTGKELGEYISNQLSFNGVFSGFSPPSTPFSGKIPAIISSRG